MLNPSYLYIMPFLIAHYYNEYYVQSCAISETRGSSAANLRYLKVHSMFVLYVRGTLI